jgi:hypothetical protein
MEFRQEKHQNVFRINRDKRDKQAHLTSQECQSPTHSGANLASQKIDSSFPRRPLPILCLSH